MIYLINKKQSTIIIYIILVLFLLNYFIIDSSYSSTNDADDLKFPYLLTAQYQSEILNIQELPRNRISLDILYRIASIFGLILVCSYNLIVDYRYLTYIYLHISRLFIILQRLLLPRKNSSRYKASLITKYTVQSKLIA
ncbi:hypothetical protein CLFO_15860 [Clostridium formicaceticum]|uniref:Uncharacterized protein n=1 Tax=Clostridium formicaceticum TaxID=1497 RepID=A0AAC9RKY1_9CLOT|nr:hypothetical protein CLFO_15860 [Clostridium formicaceticum]